MKSAFESSGLEFTNTNPTTEALNERGDKDAYTFLSDLEGALAILSGLSEAINELSGDKANPERRLSAICAIGSPMHDEIERAREACRELYGLYFASKKAH